MSDQMPTPPAPEPGQQFYEETVVEYADNRRQRLILIVIVAILFLLLIGVSYAVVRLTPGKGAPTGKAATPVGITWVRSIYGWGSGVDQQLVTPTDVAIAPDGTIWVLSGHNTLVGFNPDGSARQIIKPKGVISMEGVAVGDDGNIYVADFGGQVLEFSPTGKLLDQWKVELPSEVDVQGGNIAIAASKGIAVITRENSKVLLQLGGTRGWLPGQFDLPHGIILNDDGSLFISDTQNRRVKALDKRGRNVWVLGDAPDRTKPGVADVRSAESTIASAPFMLPSGMTLDGSGRLLVVDPFKFNLTVVDPKTGKIAHEDNNPKKRPAVYGEFGQQDGFFTYPTGVSYDRTRDWIAVADTGNNRVQILRIPGTGGSVVAPLIGGFRWPMLLLCIPWILLLVLLAIMMIRRRRRDKEPEGALESGEAAAGSIGFADSGGEA